MALRDQPYLPLYVQDFMTDEKLAECSASSTGVYVRIMCIMHKSEEYGTILLRQKDRQNHQQNLSSSQNFVYSFAVKIAKQTPFDVQVVFSALCELIEEKVLHIEDQKLIQKRMVKDFSISLSRSAAGKKGAFATANKPAKRKQRAKAKVSANVENEYEIENEDINLKEINKAPLTKHLFKDSEFYDQQKFIEAYSGTDYEHYNLPYYYECVKNWSAQGNKKTDWIATARGFMLRDFKDNKAVLKNGTTSNQQGKGEPTGKNVSVASAFARIDRMYPDD